MGAEERALRRERKTQKRAKAVDARSVADLTRAIVSHLVKSFKAIPLNAVPPHRAGLTLRQARRSAWGYKD